MLLFFHSHVRNLLALYRDELVLNIILHSSLTWCKKEPFIHRPSKQDFTVNLFWNFWMTILVFVCVFVCMRTHKHITLLLFLLNYYNGVTITGSADCEEWF